jgi:hypothetical protein
MTFQCREKRGAQAAQNEAIPRPNLYSKREKTGNLLYKKGSPDLLL